MKTFTSTIILLFSLSVFSQITEKPLWMQLEGERKYLEVVSHLLFQVQSDTTRNKHSDYLHIARNYGYLNDYEKASFYWKKSYDYTGKNDDEFRLYYEGTLAFFERDKEKLRKSFEELDKKQNRTHNYKNNYRTLRSLHENFEKGYYIASHIWHEGWRNANPELLKDLKIKQ